MVELGAGTTLFRAIGIAYWVVALALVAAALWFPKRRSTKAILAIVVAALFLGFPISGYFERKKEQRERSERHAVARAHWEMRCQSALDKVYETASDVDGILLLKVRPVLSAENYKDPNFPGAALAGDTQGTSYIWSFLAYEQRNPDGSRAYINNERSSMPGYSFVDYVDPADGKRYRYTLGNPRELPVPNIVRSEVQLPPPRYALDFEDIVDPVDRSHWVAGTRLIVIDTLTGKVMAEKTFYLFDQGLGATGGGRLPWASGYLCPRQGGMAGSRFFVDQVLKPRSRS
jgi:hypothetical protein